MMNAKLALMAPAVMIALAAILTVLMQLYPNMDLSYFLKIPTAMLAIGGTLVFLFPIGKLTQEIKHKRLRPIMIVMSRQY